MNQLDQVCEHLRVGNAPDRPASLRARLRLRGHLLTDQRHHQRDSGAFGIHVDRGRRQLLLGPPPRGPDRSPAISRSLGGNRHAIRLHFNEGDGEVLRGRARPVPELAGPELREQRRVAEQDAKVAVDAGDDDLGDAHLHERAPADMMCKIDLGAGSAGSRASSSAPHQPPGVSGRDFHFGRPGRHRYTPNAIPRDRTCSWPSLQAPELIISIIGQITRVF